MEPIVYLSLGGGVQSGALYIMGCLGELGDLTPRFVIYSDTRCDAQWTYDALDDLERWGHIPIRRLRAKHLGRKALDRFRESGFVPIPVWFRGPTGRPIPGNRECSAEYKVKPIITHIRRLTKTNKRKHMRRQVKCLLGISAEEAQRMKPSTIPWIENCYPLIDRRMTRQDCQEVYRRVGLEPPRRSSCLFCPFHSVGFWRDLRLHSPADWRDAVLFDRALRLGGEDLYLTSHMVPIEELVERDDIDGRSDSFGNECQGMCGV